MVRDGITAGAAAVGILFRVVYAQLLRSTDAKGSTLTLFQKQKQQIE